MTKTESRHAQKIRKRRDGSVIKPKKPKNPGTALKEELYLRDEFPAKASLEAEAAFVDWARKHDKFKPLVVRLENLDMTDVVAAVWRLTSKLRMMTEQPPFIRRRCPSCERIISDAWIERQRKKTGKHPTKHSCGERLRDPAGCLHFRSQTEQLDSVYGRCMECGLLLKRGEDTRFYFEFEEEKVDDKDRK